jgi:regulator of replication initiation timing
VIKSSYILAINSIRTKKEERLLNVSKNFDKFAYAIKDESDLKEVTNLNQKAKLLYEETVNLRLESEKANKESNDLKHAHTNDKKNKKEKSKNKEDKNNK